MSLNSNDLLGGYTHEELGIAFKRVENTQHWKGPIDALIDEPDDREVAKILFAIEFFTATEGRATRTPSGFVLITAPGYWNGPAN